MDVGIICEKCLLEKYENSHQKYITDSIKCHTGLSHRDLAAACMSLMKGMGSTDAQACRISR